MGANLAQNFESHGFTVAVYNRTTEKTRAFAAAQAGKHFLPAETLPDFVTSLATPRKILLMVKAGEAVDQFIDQLLPLLNPGDILIDGGNSHFLETEARVKKVEAAGQLFVGMGVSGGEEGALHGPALMPGGSRDAWPILQPLLEAIAAKVNQTEPCCSWIGDGGSGHLVKMVHNGIEYADMQLISEAYSLLHDGLKLDQLAIQKIFQDWNQGPLASYLIEITAHILGQKDDQGDFLLPLISDAAAQKGTGKWTAQVALDLGVAIPTIIEAVNARLISSLRAERQQASEVLKIANLPESNTTDPKPLNPDAIAQALYCAKIVSYAQGFALLQAAADAYGWQLNLPQIAAGWRGGCIIRAEVLDLIMKSVNHTNLLVTPAVVLEVLNRYEAWQQTTIFGIAHSLSLPGFTSALAYFEAYRSPNLPTNLIQAQRDFFGAHSYERIDKSGKFHTTWA